MYQVLVIKRIRQPFPLHMTPLLYLRRRMLLLRKHARRRSLIKMERVGMSQLMDHWPRLLSGQVKAEGSRLRSIKLAKPSLPCSARDEFAFAITQLLHQEEATEKLLRQKA